MDRVVDVQRALRGKGQAAHVRAQAEIAPAPLLEQPPAADEDGAVEDVGRGQVLALEVALVGLRGEWAHAVALETFGPVGMLVLDLDPPRAGMTASTFMRPLSCRGARGMDCSRARALRWHDHEGAHMALFRHASGLSSLVLALAWAAASPALPADEVSPGVQIVKGAAIADKIERAAPSPGGRGGVVAEDEGWRVHATARDAPGLAERHG